MSTRLQQHAEQPTNGCLHFSGSASVLDACCSIRAFWFDKNDPRAVFVDNRKERIVRKDNSIRSPRTERVLDINPDIVADFTSLPFADNRFALVVFDPPHKQRTEANGGFLVQHYGMLKGEWKEMLRGGFAECFRVLRPEGVLIFKWAETEFPVSEILALTPEKPLFGHKSGKNAGTHWIAFMKQNNQRQATASTQP
jgi:SAM-dependent methyltransferase